MSINKTENTPDTGIKQSYTILYGGIAFLLIVGVPLSYALAYKKSFKEVFVCAFFGQLIEVIGVIALLKIYTKINEPK